ncbi:Ubiquitin carboxyl-terminal hydrolase 19 [Platanthera guangdongensis]|uniref:Ubiquitin carboxyl-terminal hydrolase 19 n=1 Tax=Platanthera guangdongensis TaxID=2320717 RepID=A0ABR2MHK6_9ASPA
MLGVASLSLDLSALLQFACTALAFLGGALILIRKAASRYFVVDAGFEGPVEFQSRLQMPIGSGGNRDAGGLGESECAFCARSASKKCSRCKSVWYCSEVCQTNHWKAEHKSKCRKAESSFVKFEICGTGARRKSAKISLVPDHGTHKLLKEPKKILFPYHEFVKFFDWDKPAFPPCGLLNCGNSCFANVVLQCLTCTRPLVAYLLEKDHTRECLRREDWCFLCELQVHIKRASESSQPFSPINILSRLPNIGGNLGYGRQEDAHEFMRFAIDTMQSICLDEYGGEKAVDPNTQATTIVQYIFGGHLQSQVICTNCDVVSNRYENMMDLTVEIQGGSESLEECLDQFTVKEWLDGENMYKCDGCNGYVKAWKRLTVHQAPNVLTIALKRFQSGRFGKLNKRVTFPEDLNLTPYMSASGRDGTDHYELYGVVVHLDMLNASYFGHYICYMKDYRGSWYRIDDCKVIKVEVEEVLVQGAYMLLYHRKNPRKDLFVKPADPTVNKNLPEIDCRASTSEDTTESSPSAASTVSSASVAPSTPCTDADAQTNISHSEMLSEAGSTLRDTGHDRRTDGRLDHEDQMDLDAPVTSSAAPVLSEIPDHHNGTKPDCMYQNASSMMSVDPEPLFTGDACGHGSSFAGPCGANESELQNSSKYGANGAELQNASNSVANESELQNSSKYGANGPDMEASIACIAPSQCADGICPVVSPLEFKRPNGTVTANGSIEKSKPIFRRGFLDRPVSKKPTGWAKTFPAEKRTNNGYPNGHMKIGSDIQMASGDVDKEAQ